jgi:hypothetical protein
MEETEESKRRPDPDPKKPERRARGIAGESEGLNEEEAPEREEDEASWESFPASDAPPY